MPLPPVGADVDQSPDVQVDLSPQVTLDSLLPFYDLTNSYEICLAQVLDPGVIGNPDTVQDLFGLVRTNAINSCERVLHTLVIGDVYPCN
jgi:hypothetical protein